LMLDWAGSSDEGFEVINNKTIVASLVYNESSSTMYLESCVDFTTGMESGPSNGYMLGSRGADPTEPDRYFFGDLVEVAIFNRSLLDSERMEVTRYMELEWNITDSDPNCTPQYNCSLMSPYSDQLANLTHFVQVAGANESTSQTYVVAHAGVFIGTLDAYVSRCNMLVNGTLPPLPTPASDEAALASYLSSAQQLWIGFAFVMSQYEASSDPLEQALFQLWLA
jgi:hypothetical protein